MKKIILLVCCLTSLSLFGQGPVLEWAKKIGGTNNESGRSIATDPLGNIYVTGSFYGIVDFDPGPDEFILNAIENAHAFVAKYTANGQFLWAHAFGDSYWDVGGSEGNKITTDTSGNVFITGEFEGKIDFDPGPGTHFLTFYEEDYYPYENYFFILKLNTDGEFMWAKQIVGRENAIVVDNNGNVYTTGYDYRENDDEDYYKDIFIYKLSNEGNFVWEQSIGGEDASDSGLSIALDNANNVFATGYFRDTVDFDAGPDQFNLTAEEQDLFVLKLSNEGDFIWAANMGGLSSNTEGSSITVDAGGNLYLSGHFDGVTDFDPGPDAYYLSSSSEKDIFFTKLNSNGDFIWAKNIGGEGNDYASNITLGNNNHVFISGFCNGIVDFDPGLDTFNLPAGVQFLLKLDSAGSFIWAAPNIGSLFTLDNSGFIFTTGSFGGTTDFDQDCRVYELISNGSRDIFIHKMNQELCAASPIINSPNTTFGICLGDSITLNADMPCWDVDFLYSWNTGATSDSILLMPNSSSTYTVNVNYTVDTTVCNTSASIEVLVFVDEVEVPYNGYDEDCDETTLDDDLDQDGLNFANDCDDNNPNVPTSPGIPCDDENSNTSNDIILNDSCTCAGNPITDGPVLEWVYQLGGIDSDLGGEIITDQWGNVYAAGIFRNTVDFDPGPSETILSAGSSAYMVFVSKFAPGGQLIWAVSFGDSSNVSEVTFDSIGNIYLTGNFKGTVDFDPGPNTYNLSTISHYNSNYILKLDTTGSFIWAKKIGDSGVYGGDIAIDDSNNIYATGHFYGTDDFDPGPGVFQLSAAGWVYYHEPDVFILKLNSAGNFVWAKQMGGESSDRGGLIALDSANNIYMTFNDCATTFFSYSGMTINKLNSDGDLIWSKSLKGPASGSDIALDKTGNIYTAGSFYRTVDFDPGPETFNLSQYPHPDNDENYDIFVSKLSNEGDFIWANSFGAAEDDGANAIALDKNGNIYTTGSYSGIVDFDPGPSSYNLSSINDKDVFILELDTNGEFVWAGSFAGNSKNDGGSSIALDDLDNIYTTGYFQYTLDFDPNLDVYDLVSNGSYDAFIHKMSQPDTIDTEEELEDFNPNGYSIFPNPANEIINIHFEDHSTYEISLFDVLGRVVVRATKYLEQAQIDVSQFSAGIYFLKISRKGEVYCEKVEVLR